MKSLVSLSLLLLFFGFTAYASDWHEEFETLCSQSEKADSMSVEELKTTITRVEALVPVVESSDDAKKKVYLFRLKKCLDFLQYMVELKDSKDG